MSQSKMLAVIGTLRSGTQKGLIVAFVSWAISLSGLAEQFPDAEGYVDGALNALAALGMLYAGYSRQFKPSPPLTEIAAAKTTEMVADGKLKTVVANTGDAK